MLMSFAIASRVEHRDELQHLSQSCADTVIDVCESSQEHQGQRPFGRRDLLAELEENGITIRKVEQPTAGVTCLLFGTVESNAIRDLAPETRSSVVLIAEGEIPAVAESESARDALGLLGLVEPRAWRNWQRGLFVAWGFYGRADVATLAGLAPRDSQGLQPTDHREALPATLAKFLLAAERSLSISPAK
jgi:hypothetical protein